MANLFRRTATQLARGVDKVFAGAALNPPQVLRRRSSSESLGHDDRMRALSLIGGFYNRESFVLRDGPFFTTPRPITPAVVHVRKLGREGEVVDLSWASEFTPLWSSEALVEHFGSWAQKELEQAGIDPTFTIADIAALGVDRSGPLTEKYRRAHKNRNGHARWWRHHDGRRPTVVILHGYMVGEYAIEERMWPVQRLFDSGLDVVLSVLPFHGLRRSETRGILPPAFPSGDPRFTIEGFRQLVFDHRALFDYLEREGVPAFGVMGVSLGGYGASLLATLEERLKLAVLFIPLAAIEEFAHTHGRLVGNSDQQAAQREAMRKANWAVSPFSRTPLISGNKVVVIAGDADAITGGHHAERLTSHFDAELSRFHGGHLLHFGRTRAFEAMWRLLSREGFTR
jgi:alpha-beta hydrolase superfamily lysophospholipase